jgi:hypothetical protein
MEQNYKEWPEVVFDWLEHSTYEDLGKRQKDLILSCGSEEDYSEMYLALQAIRKSKDSGYYQKRLQSRNYLLNVFD